MSTMKELHALIGKRIVGVIRGSMSSNNMTHSNDIGLILEDQRGRRSFLGWETIEETDAAFYGTELIYPARDPRKLDTEARTYPPEHNNT